jgi:peroxiredoxin
MMRRHPAGTALTAGDTAPNFELPDLRGGTLQLRAALKNGPVVVRFHLQTASAFAAALLQNHDDAHIRIEALGATIVGVFPEDPRTPPQDGVPAPFAMLSDRQNLVAANYGVIVPQRRGANNRPVSDALASFVVDTTGRIVLAFIDPACRNPLQIVVILAALTGLAPKAGLNPRHPTTSKPHSKCGPMRDRYAVHSCQE